MHTNQYSVIILIFSLTLVTKEIVLSTGTHPLQAFITDHERALEELYGENAENSRNFDTCLNTMAKRIATVFASLKVFS